MTRIIARLFLFVKFFIRVGGVLKTITKENYVTPIVMKDIIEDMKYEITPIQ